MKAKILLVEDSPGDIILTREALEEHEIEHELFVVNDGNEAMSFLKNHCPYKQSPRPDIVILDLNLPRKDGRQVLKEIKSDYKLKSIPVIVLSTSDNDTDIAMSYRNHANCYITKPMDFDRFSKAVKSIQDFWFGTVSLPPK